MTSSFSVPKADVEYPLSNLQRLLAFSDMEVVKLCCHWLFCKIFSGEQCFFCGAFRDSVPFVPFKKREKYPWRSVTLVLLHGCFSRCFKLYKCYKIAQRIIYKKSLLSEILESSDFGLRRNLVVSKTPQRN